MKTLRTFLAEAGGKGGDYVIYHDSYTSAIQEVERLVKKRGYMMDEDELAREVGMGPRKPSNGKTNKFTITLYKDKKALADKKADRKGLHFQIYNRGTSRNEYELNAYIS